MPCPQGCSGPGAADRRRESAQKCRMPAAPGGRAASPPGGAEKARRERSACSACHNPGVDVQNTQLLSTANDYG